MEGWTPSTTLKGSSESAAGVLRCAVDIVKKHIQPADTACLCPQLRQLGLLRLHILETLSNRLYKLQPVHWGVELGLGTPSALHLNGSG